MNTQDNIDALPNELVIHILSFIDSELLRNVATVSKRWNSLSVNEHLWETRNNIEKNIYFKIAEITWRQLFRVDTSGVCKHLNNITNPSKIISILREEWHTKETKCHGSKQNAIPCLCPFNNLWICVEGDCFNIGCGRRDNVHAMGHFNTTKHALTLKLNTFEMWCYGCERWIGQKGSNLIEAGRVFELQNNLYKACNNVPPTDIMERRQQERDFEQAKKGDIQWAIAEIGWIKKWERFIIGDFLDFSEQLDNTPLLNHTGTAVRFGLTRDDYRVFSMSAWEVISNRYGGGPLIVYDWNVHRWIVEPETVQ